MTYREKLMGSGNLGACGRRMLAVVLLCCALLVGTGHTVAWADEQEEIPLEFEVVESAVKDEATAAAAEELAEDPSEEATLSASSADEGGAVAEDVQTPENPQVAAYVEVLRTELPADADKSVLVAYAYRDLAAALALEGYDTDAVSPAARELLASVASSGDVAHAFAQVMDTCGVVSKVVRADGSEGAYQWVMVQLDGVWYHVDTARAAGELYVNVENRVEPLEVLSKWLLVSDDALRATRKMRANDVWSTEDGGELPVATASFAWPEGQAPQDFLGAIEVDLPEPEPVVAEDEGAAEESVSEEPELTAQATGTSGECGIDCVWSLDSEGLLTIEPASGKETGTLSLEHNVSAGLAAAFKLVISKGTTYNYGSISQASWTGEYDYFLVPNGGDGNPILFVGKELETNTSVFSWRYLAFKYDASSNTAKQLSGTPLNVTVISDDEKNLYTDGSGLLYRADENSNGSYTMRKCVVLGASLQWSTYETLADEEELFYSDYEPLGYSDLDETDQIDEYIEDHGSTLSGTSQAPWYDVRNSIKKVLVKSGVVSGASLRGLFKDCAKLEEADFSGLDNHLATDCTDMFGITIVNGIKLSPLKKLITGSNYSTSIDGAVPNSAIGRGRHKNQWYSKIDQKWCDASYIRKNRSKTANTYTICSDLVKSDHVETRFGSRLTVKGDDPTYPAIVEVKWDDGWFAKSSSTYNHDLGTVASILANNVYHDAGERDKKPEDAFAYDSLLDLGFDMSTYYADYPQNDDENEDNGKDKDQVGYCFAVKWMGEEKTPLVAILIRGTASEWEWVSNFNLAESDLNRQDHEGFYRAFEKVRDALQTYLSSGKGNKVNLSDACFLVTGHSRGAAVANLMSYALNSGEIRKGNASSTRERVYSYTFATPNPTLEVTSSSDASLQNARFNSNIFSILNPEDIVTKAALKQWGFSRYGVNKFLPNKNTDKDFSSKYSMSSVFSELSNGGEASWFANGYFAANDIREALADTAAGVYDYYNKWTYTKLNIPVPTPNGVIANPSGCTPAVFMAALGHSKDNSSKYGGVALYLALTHYPNLTGRIIVAADNIVIASLYDGWKLWYLTKDAYYTVNSLKDGFLNNPSSWINGYKTYLDLKDIFVPILSAFINMHTPETYTAWMLAGSKDMFVDSSRIGRFACPVDVRVYDSNGSLVCSIVDDEIDEQVMLNGLAAKVEGGVKYVAMPGNENYRIEATATDDGTMDISYADCTAEGDTISQATYTDLPLKRGETYQVIVDEQGQTLSPVQEATVTNPSGTTLSPAHVATGSEVSSLDIRVVVGQGDGSVSGSAMATWGDPIVATAVPAEGASFIGWYEGNTRVSKDAQYQFRAEESRTIEARFSKSIVFSSVASIKNKTYTGKAIAPDLTVKYNGKTLKKDTDYTVTYKNNVKVGTATVTITGKGSFTGRKTVNFKIVKANNGLTAKGSTKAVKLAKVAKKKQVVKKVIKVTKANGKVSYTLVKAKKTKKFAINKNTGAITVPKATKKGTYKLKVKVNAAGDANHNAATKTVKVVIKVK